MFMMAAGTVPAQEEVPPPSPGRTEPLPEISGAIYLDTWQIEKEFVISPLALQEWVDLDLGITPDSRLTPAQRADLKPRIGQFLERACPVLIDGDEVDFTLDRVHFIEPNDLEFVLIDEDAEVAVKDIRISAVFARPNTAPDQPIHLLWTLFPEGVTEVPVTVADAGGSRIFRVRPNTPTVGFFGRYLLGAREAPKAPPPPVRATMELPWLTILLILAAIPVVIRAARKDKTRTVSLLVLVLLAGGAAAARKAATIPIPHPFKKADNIEAEQTARILDALLRGVYHAFNFPEEEKQYDVLAEVVWGPTLTEIFLEVQRTLESRERDGSRVRVSDLSVTEAAPEPLDGRRGFRAACTWEVSGRVGHWGHFHDRTNRYGAIFVVEPVEESWKITGLTMQARERDPAP